MILPEVSPYPTPENTLKTRVLFLLKTVRYANPRYYAIAVMVAFCLVAWAYTIAFFWPKTLQYSYAHETCSTVPTYLPALHKADAGSNYSFSFKDEKRIAGMPIVARKSCVELVSPAALSQNITVHLKVLGTPLSQQFTIPATPLPKIMPTQQPTLIATTENVLFTLDKPDTTFSYYLEAGNKRSPCVSTNTQLRCAVAPLTLNQGQLYVFSLQRQFKQQSPVVLVTQKMTTVEPITVASGTIAPNATVYDAPQNLTLTFNKPIATTGTITIKAGSQTIAHSSSTDGARLIISFAEALPRSTKFDVTIEGTTATDKGYLVAPFVTSFTTSGGPKVSGKNIGTYNIAPNSTIRLNFDVAIKPDNAQQFIQLESGKQIIPAKVSVDGNQVTLTPGRNFGVCETFSIHVLDGIQNIYGISGGSSYTFTSRSTCGTSFSIGTSVEGRAIMAHKFGSGPTTILYIGATHGSEYSSKYILDSWVDYLESVAPSIPASRTVIVIPSINPDGVAHGTRTNAHNVDLNRNFPANSWKADVTVPGGQLIINGGGTSPLSEPESAAIAGYTQSIHPRLVLTYHSKASLITANESGDSMALATLYGKKTGYRAVAESQLGNTFNYDTTGAYENWLHDKLDIPTLLIELPDHTSNFFNSNRDVMWSLVGL